MLFCAAAAPGFATLENVFYVFTAGDHALGMAVVRAALPLHVVFGIVMGYGMGRARAVRGTTKETEWLVKGFVGAVALHGLWNFLIHFGSVVSLLNVPLFVLAWVVAFRAIRRALTFSPFVRCTGCRRVIPRVSAHCPFCRRRRHIYLRCHSCRVEVFLGDGLCPQCHSQLARPWHLRVERLPQLYRGSQRNQCLDCQAPLPPGSRYCPLCGTPEVMGSVTKGTGGHGELSQLPLGPLLILDIDETLLHSSPEPLGREADITLFGRYWVYLRPGLAGFLETAAEHYRLAFWTTAGREYAEQVIGHLALSQPPEFLWTEDRCTRRLDPETQEIYWIKDLKKVERRGEDLARVLVVEDTPRAIERQYGNVIPVRAYAGEPEDQELGLLAAYLSGIAGCSNVRALEKRHWRHGVTPRLGPGN